MTKNPRINQLISFVGILVVILLMVFKKEPKPIYKISSYKTIEKRIDEKESNVLGLLHQVAADRKIIDAIGNQIFSLKVQLKDAKYKSDTVQVIKLQDNIIYQQDSTISQYIRMDQRKDSIIWDQRYIINSKDTIIAKKDHDLKRVKKQRNISLLINALQTGIIILK